MASTIKLLALSAAMEEATLASWRVAEGDAVQAGDVIAEIETDKATMELQAGEAGIVAKLLVAGGTENVAVGTAIAVLATTGETIAEAVGRAAADGPPAEILRQEHLPSEVMHLDTARRDGEVVHLDTALRDGSERAIRASPLARKLAAVKQINLGQISGSGPRGRIVKSDIERLGKTATFLPGPALEVFHERNPHEHHLPHEVIMLSGMRKTIAKRLTEAKQQIPHIYLTVDIHLDPLLRLRREINDGLAQRAIKVSVNDLLIKAQALALLEVPSCNVQFSLDRLLCFKTADIAVAVSIPNGLITPIITSAHTKTVSAIAQEMKSLAGRAREGKLQPQEYQGGTASLSNMGMHGIKQFEAIINPPQAMILAIGAGEKRPYAINDTIALATVMSVTGSFDHRAIDGADGAAFMAAFKRLIENPLSILA